MKNFLLPILVLALVASCSPKNIAKVVINIEDAADSTEVVVAKLAVNRLLTVDTLYVKEQKISFQTECAPGAPDFYYFMSNNKKVASVVLGGKESVEITTNLKGEVASVEGSEDSKQLVRLDKDGDEASRSIVELSQNLISAQESKDTKKASELSLELRKVYVKYKQDATKYILTNSKSITVIPVIYRKLTPSLPLFGEVNDLFLLKSIYDSLNTVYPNSPYVISLGDDIKVRTSYMEFEHKLTNVQEMKYPDISLYDQNAKVRNLSELDGKVIILSFWSVSEPTHKIFNAELKELYKKYSKSGLEVYQVSIDPDKTAWARQVKDQGLEWVSVIDPGNISRTLELYNVQKVPAIYVIDKKGDIVKKDLFNMTELEKLISTLVR